MNIIVDDFYEFNCMKRSHSKFQAINFWKDSKRNPIVDL